MIEEKLTAYLNSADYQSQKQALKDSLSSKPLFHPPLTAPDKQAAVLIPFIQQQSGSHILLTQRADHLSIHAGQIAFPGGRLEDQDMNNLMTTAIRETHEETGLELQQITVLQQIGAWPSLSGYMVNAYVGMIQPPYAYKPCETEVAEIFEVPISHILDISKYAQKTISRGKMRADVYYIDYQDKHIWGFTAGVLYYLAHILQPLSLKF